MKHFIPLVFAATACCGRAVAMPPEAAAVFEKAGVSLTDADLYRVAEVYNFWEQKGEEIWPGMHIATTPVQFIFPEKLDVLIGSPKPPEDCVKEEVKLPGFDRTFCHRPDRKFLYGAATGREGGDLAVSVNTLEVFDAYVNALMRKQRPDAEKYEKPYLLYLGEIAHELTHAYQNYEARQLPEREMHGALRMTKVDYPYQDAEACLLLGLEGRILSDIIDETDPGRTRELWRDFLAVRRARRARLPGDLALVEKVMELREGTAQYVGWSVQYGKNDDIKPLPQLAADPRFTGYASSDTLRDTLKRQLGTLELPVQSQWMRYVYITGAALAYSLDKAVPGWKNGLFRRVGGIKTGLDDLLAARVPPDGGDKRRLAAVRARYDTAAMTAAVKDALEKDLAENKVKLDRFYAAPGKRVRFYFSGAKPEEVTVLGPVMLTEYGKLRVFEAGVNRVAYNLGEKDERSVLFLKALPVLIDRATGRLELALPDGTAPSVKAGKRDVKKGRTVYSGGVEYDNGVFTWKGERLEVVEKDGITTLTF